MQRHELGGTILARMHRCRLALILMIGGFCAKGVAVVCYRLFHPPFLARILTTFDPLGVSFSNAVLPLLFDLRGIAPPAGAPPVFELLLVFAFAAQCFILGLAISEAGQLLRKHHGSRQRARPAIG